MATRRSDSIDATIDEPLNVGESPGIGKPAVESRPANLVEGAVSFAAHCAIFKLTDDRTGSSVLCLQAALETDLEAALEADLE